MERTLENAKKADGILRYFSQNSNITFSGDLQQVAFSNLTAQEVEFIFIWITEEFGDNVKHGRGSGGNGSCFIGKNNKTDYFLSNGGVTKIIEDEIELKTMHEANTWYTTENAKRQYDNYEADQLRLEKAETRARNAEKIAIFAVIVTAIGIVIQWLRP
jgi:hypothetical protein